MKNKSQSLQHFWKYFRNYRGLIFIGVLFLIASQIAATAQPIFLRNIINALTDHKAIGAITIILFYYFGVKLIDIIAEFIRDYFLSPVVMGVPRDFEKDIFAHLLNLPVSYHANSKTGAAARAITRGAQAISFMLDFSISSLVPPLLQLIFVTILLLKLYSWQYGIITFATVVVYAIFTIWSTEKRNVFRQAGNDKDDQAGGLLVDSVSNIETVKYFGNQNIAWTRFSKIKQEWFKLFVKSNRLFALIFGVQGVILLVGLGLIFVLALKQVTAGTITIGDLVLLSTYVVQLSIPITSLGFVYGRFKNSITDLQAMDNILSEQITIIEPENPKKIKNLKGEIDFCNVNFGYSPNRKVINDISLMIKPGQKAAFVGPSGAGKSTIAKLIFRLYDINSGSIKIDDVDIKMLSVKDRARILAIVPQDPALFNDTIAENIRFGKMEASFTEIRKAAKVAQIDDFIMGLPKKYETMVGERGIKVSGGQRQRIAIARAMIKNPKILVFDEATSSLDSRSEQAVLKTIDRVKEGRTSISIAHRLSTIIKSDIIFVLKGSKIVEQGTHQQLIKQNGEYAHLWKIQSQSK